MEDLDESVVSSDDAIEELHAQIGDWVLVAYEGETFPGEVIELGATNTDLRVNVMHQAGGYWRWPKDPDQIFYLRENVIIKISLPVVVGSRGQYMFTF